MAIEKVKRVQILGFQELQKDTLKNLQEAEVIHLEQPSFKSIVFEDTSESRDIKKAVNFLASYEEKSFLGDIFKESFFLKKKDFKRASTEDLQSIIKEILNSALKKEQLHALLQDFKARVDSFLKFSFIDVSLAYLQSLKYFSFLFIKVSIKGESKLKDIFQKKEAFIQKVSCIGKSSIFLVLIRKEYFKEAFELLKEKNFKVLDLPISIWEEFQNKSCLQAASALESQIEDIKSQIKEIDKMSNQYLTYKEKLMLLYDLSINENFKQDIEKNTLKTKRLFLMDGWILARQEKQFLEALGKLGDKIYVAIRQPKKGETPPSKLKNAKPLEPFQMIVDMYGAPHPKSLDPTLSVAPFFFLFVGLCLSDAGYGIALFLFSFYILKKKKLTYGAKNFFKLLCYLGIATFFVGLGLGNFFGISLPFKLIDILNYPFQFLLFCFLLGYIQILLGTGLRIFIEFKNRNYQKGLLYLSWMGLILSIVVFFTSKMVFLKFLSFGFVGAIILLASPTKNIFARIGIGLYELYGITRYFSDILSYSRLLALCMATGVIAMVINLLAKLTFQIPVIGIIAGLGILLGGHIFNILINLMSGFIHSARLQFVEFFSKFFELGTKFFEPLKIKTKYIKLIDN